MSKTIDQLADLLIDAGKEVDAADLPFAAGGRDQILQDLAADETLRDFFNAFGRLYAMEIEANLQNQIEVLNERIEILLANENS